MSDFRVVYNNNRLNGLYAVIKELSVSEYNTLMADIQNVINKEASITIPTETLNKALKNLGK